jgi:23S rRNA (adenine2503-C2)-methyltransferase
MTTWNKIEDRRDEKENVTKYVFTKDDAVAEAVLYKYPTYQQRTVICCSTQSGCPIGCRFCGAGDHFVRSLSTEEIVSQSEKLLGDTDCDPSEIEKLQIMFMSMGEPFLNLTNLIPAMKQLHALYPNARLLISTSAPRVSQKSWQKLLDVAASIPTVGLQFSIHESTDDARNELIPFEKKFSLLEMATMGHEFFRATGRNPYFNYCAHDRNTSDEDVARLMALFDPLIFCATVSVVCERDEGMQAKNEHQRRLALDFGNKLLSKGFDVRVFDPAGQDTIGGGCGQLWFVQNWLKVNSSQPSIGYGKPKVHAPMGERS